MWWAPVLGGSSVPEEVLGVLVSFVMLIVHGYHVSGFAFVVGVGWVIFWWVRCLGIAFQFSRLAVLG